ncbi:DMT family transporter [Novosphingobium terrae]|uniref:DMT family transporter n=1 Tax=Novosphingobium terrae TaxID=2726189 RepID=UPI00197DA5A5|nr:DMT family transporter [Novosphingobium terrae]
MIALFILLAIAGGVTSALQSGSNQMLQRSLTAPLWTVAIISAVTLIAALILPLVAGEKLPQGQAIAQAPWWAWAGGVFGLGFVMATVYATPRLGAGLFVGLIVTASTVASLLLDNFGWMGFSVHPAGLGRIAGGVLMIVGVALIAAF